MGLLFVQQIEEPRTAHNDLSEESIEIFQQLKSQQHMLES